MAQTARASEKIVPEDQITNALIDQAHGKCSVEVPYNNYGERGYVDLVANKNSGTYITEVKSCPKSANDVIRQFQKMRDNFLDGTNYDEIKSRKFYWLIFTASHRNLEHIRNNKEMYRSLLKQDSVLISMVDDRGVTKSVFRGKELNIGDRIGMTELKGISNDKEERICPYCGKEYEMESYYKKHVQECFE